jgi:site-specific DNA recombinase
MTKPIVGSNPETYRKLLVILYLRVSTDEQSRSGFGLDRQIKSCLEYTRRHGFELAGDSYLDANTGLVVRKREGLWEYANPTMIARFKIDTSRPIIPVRGYMDDFTGTVPIEQRPEGSRVFELLKCGDADALVVEEMSRLVRPKDEGDEWDVSSLIKGLAKLGREIHATNRGKIGLSFAEMLIAVFDAKQAGDARRDLLRKSMSGRIDKTRQGMVVGSCLPRYGYRFVRNEQGRIIGYAIAEEQARIVRLVYHWFVFGDETGKRLPIEQIAKRLDRDGMPRPTELHQIKTHRAVKFWHPSTIRRMLSCRAYIGEYEYNGATAKMPRLISDALFDKAQKIHALNARLQANNCKRPYLLATRIKCPCGRHLVGQTLRVHGEQRYRCNEAVKRRGGCAQRSIQGKDIETFVWEGLKYAFGDLSHLEAQLREAQQNDDARSQPLREELELIRGEITESDEEGLRLAAALLKAEGDLRERFEFLEKQYNARREHLSKRREELEELLGSQGLTDKTVSEILSFAKAVIQGLRTDDFEMKRLMLDVLKVEVTIHGDEYTVNSLVTGWSGKILRRAGCAARILNPEDIPQFCRQLPLYRDVLAESRWSSGRGKSS